MRCRRIIPARAGFTLLSIAPCREVGGSSPLARGLQGGVAVGQVGDGIIPARAGFTEIPTHAGTVKRDHPRSRGVYLAIAVR